MKRFLLTLCLVGLPLAASAQQKIDFSGQAMLSAGGAVDMYAVVLDADPIALPLPLDFANHQYTLVFRGFTAGPPSGTSTPYGGGTVVLYEDAATPASFANPASFMDGTAILASGAAVFTRTVFTATLGTLDGTLDWTGGTRIGDLHPADRLGWDLSSGLNSMASQVEPGYDEAWDGTVEPAGEVVDTDRESFGTLKAGDS